jgi:hypothetical protein
MAEQNMQLGMLHEKLGIFLHSVHVLPKSQSGPHHIRVKKALQQFHLLLFITYLMSLNSDQIASDYRIGG